MAKSKLAKMVFGEREAVEKEADAVFEEVVIGGSVELVPSIIEAHFPMFSKDGVLLNPGECEVDKDGVVRGKVV